MVEVVETQTGLEKWVSFGDLAWLSETWFPILVGKRKKSFIIKEVAGMEGHLALTPVPPPT